MEKAVAIGGLGGSGTRIVVEIFQKMGFFMGNDLIESLDNLHFTRLLKNPEFYKNHTENDLQKRLDILFKIGRKEKLLPEEKNLYLKWSLENIEFCPFDKKRIERSLKYNLFDKKPDLWGWKEPNTHVYVDEILKYHKDLKYIHVVRNGLDMAFSGNKQQLEIWGDLFDVSDVSPNAQLEYWYKTTKRIIDLKTAFESRVYIMNFDELCKNSATEIETLSNWLDTPLHSKSLDTLLSQIEIQPKKYTKQDLNIFSENELSWVDELGFQV